MSTITVTTKSGRTLRIRTRAVGQSFGTVAELVARNGRVVETTSPPRPLGMDAAAIDDARALAETL